MKKILLILLFISICIKSNAQDFISPEKSPEEFAKQSYEAMVWYNQNLDVMSYNFNTVDAHTQNVMKNNPNIQDLNLLISLLTKPCKNDLEKVRSFYIWLIYSIKFELNSVELNRYDVQIDGSDAGKICFKKRSGVCRHISSLFYYMCTQSNIAAYYVEGAIYNGRERGHAWNAFNYNGKYYFLDATFGSQSNNGVDEDYKNFNFIINSEIYKYIYKSHFAVFCKINYDYGNLLADRYVSYETYWLLNNGCVDNTYNLKNKELIIKDKYYFGVEYIDKFANKFKLIDYSKVNFFFYSYYNANTMKVWASKYKPKAVISDKVENKKIEENTTKKTTENIEKFKFRYDDLNMLSEKDRAIYFEQGIKYMEQCEKDLKSGKIDRIPQFYYAFKKQIKKYQK